MSVSPWLLASALAVVVLAPARSTDVVAIQAGTIHQVRGDAVIEGGGTILIRDGKIAAVGKDVEIPPGARVVDYGPAAVVVPGLVAADSSYGRGPASDRTVEPGLSAVDNFDPYTPFYAALEGGVTSVYVAPARGRLIAGRGAVVKAAGAGSQRVVSASAVLHGSIAADARNTPGYWEPPVPATVDVGLGEELKQLPRTTMGALVALEELLALARGGRGEELYGPHTGPELKEALDAKLAWRMGANTATEIRALLDFFGQSGLPLVIDGASEAADQAAAIARAGASVIVESPLLANRSGRDFGKDEDDAPPRFGVAAALAEAGVRFAIATPSDASPGDLRLAAVLASRGGLDPAAGLRAITLSAAEILGVAQRVGHISRGADADLAVLNGAPLDAATGVIATWVDGEVAWKAREEAATVIEVAELHMGDGHVLAPGQLLMQDGRIAEVGAKVSHPPGATVVRGHAAMPGMIDAYGHLGLEGSRKGVSTRFSLSLIVEPGDATDRRVAKAGVTTVVLGSPGSPGKGSQTMAYKPAGDDFETMVVGDPNALRMQWEEEIRAASGENVREALAKAKEYKEKWEQYEKEIAAWTPPPPEEVEEGKEEKEKEADEKAEGEPEKKDTAEEGEKKDEDEKKKDKKKKDEPARAVTGVWKSEGVHLALQDVAGELEGRLRASVLGGDLIEVEGSRAEKDVRLSGRGGAGLVELELALADGKLAGKARVAGAEHELALEQTSEEYPVAKRTERRRPESEKEPKGKPKSPGINPDLEPLRQAMLGKVAVVVGVDRDDEILACVAAFEAYGIKPVLFGAGKAAEVAEKLRGRVAGVLPTHLVTTRDPETNRERNAYAELQAAGIPVAFHSGAEEGAVDLPLMAAYAVAHGLSPAGAVRALTADAADMLSIAGRVGRLQPGLDADVLLLDGSPFDLSSAVVRVWVAGKEIR